MRTFLRKTNALLVATTAICIALNADAVVVQINGQICPQTPSHLQTGLNIGENGCPTPGVYPACWDNQNTPPNNNGNPGPQGPIDPQKDAALDPQVFTVPQTNGTFNKVEFLFLYRGDAGFRNTFGWYNVGDDLSNLANLHSVITCSPPTDPPSQAGGTSPGVGNWDVTVDFQAEFTAGRYKGGFIGFFLVTPQGETGTNCAPPPNQSNCGRPDNGPGCVGRIYYTEREINGDGNYVHYLVYQSKVLDAQKKRVNDYYFGFEDLYRGGDNDFKDVTMLVKGIVVPCAPQPEVCDGKDNNCDGIIDNMPVDAGGACSVIPGNPVGTGACKAGVWECLPTTPGDLTTDMLSCVGEVGPTTETCNGLDDDCDGKVDDPSGGVWVPALPNACGPEFGSCMGTTECVSGKPQCVQTVGPAPETCNGTDDDCDGVIDDNLMDVGVPCTPNPGDPVIGECHKGTTQCLNGNGVNIGKPPTNQNQGGNDTLQCVGYKGPTPELCDGKDNDCNGMIDDNPTDLSPTCTPPGVSVCQPGHEICVNGAKVCTGFTYPKPEVCNGKDDDCNGKIDDMPIDAGGPCGSSVGQCKPGVLVCAPPPGSNDPSMDMLQCMGGTGPTMEVCDGLDNNCNGQVDENPDMLPGVGVDCSTMCGSGKTICKDGMIECNGTSGGSAEVCNGKDDDCNGVIDDNPIDVGGACGNVVINPNVKQNPACKEGMLVCKPSMGNDPSTDTIQCVGENAGSPETCNGIDDDCDGVVDDNIPGDGTMDCNPPGLPPGQPITGECKPGKLYCIDGKMQCEGGIGPQPQVCDGKDHNCDGKVDDGPCPNGGICVNGSCRVKCSGGELMQCPGGQTCNASGFCEPFDCTKPGSCPAGSTCDKQTGKCTAGGAGGAAGSGASGAGGGHAGVGVGGSAGSSSNAGGAANAGGASGGGTGGKGGVSSSAGGTSGQGQQGNAGNPNENFGLATGGGGVSCAVSGERSTTFAAAIGVLAFGLAMRRRTRANGRVSTKGAGR